MYGNANLWLKCELLSIGRLHANLEQASANVL
jgi:hypothetical protein